MEDFCNIDVREDDLLSMSPGLLHALLRDNTRSIGDKQANIFWATDDYRERGAGYQYADQITVDAITGRNGLVIRPRVVKSRANQRTRSREMAEVFTPAWVCNKQNNLVDNAWFGRPGAFNTEVDRPDGTHTWLPSEGPVEFPAGRSWRDYVRDVRLEITCGEAPYLVSRYDAVSGEPIAVDRRIGLLDRKLRVVGENAADPGQWLRWAKVALQSTYAYEWQGDNIVLARENLFYTVLDHYQARFGNPLPEPSLPAIADIIAWNVWQMDGLRGVVPGACGNKPAPVASPSLFGIYALVRDWTAPDGSQTLRFIDLMK